MNDQDTDGLGAITRAASGAGIVLGGGKVLQRMRLGSHSVLLVGELSPGGAAPVAFVLSVTREGTELPSVLVISQQNKFAKFYAQGSHTMVCVHDGKRTELGHSDDWANQGAFAREALSVAASQLDIKAAPVSAAPTVPERKGVPTPVVPKPTPTIREPVSPPSFRPAPRVGGGGAKPALHIGGLIAIALIILKVVLKASSSHNSASLPIATYPTVTPSARQDAGAPVKLGPIAVDDTHVYWIQMLDGKVRKQPKRGGEPSDLATGIDRPTGLTLDATSVLVTFDGKDPKKRLAGMVRIPKTGGSPIRLARLKKWARSPITDDAGLMYMTGPPYVAESSSESDDEGYAALMALSPDGGESSIMMIDPTTGSAVSDGTFIFWVDPREGRVVKALRAGGDATALSTTKVEARFLVADGENLYFAAGNGKTSAIQKLAKTGGTPIALLEVISGSIVDLAVDEASVLFVLQSATAGTSILAIPKTGGATRMIAADVPGGTRIAVDGTQVYWSTLNGFGLVPKRRSLDGGAGDSGAGRASADAKGVKLDAGLCGGGE